MILLCFLTCVTGKMLYETPKNKKPKIPMSIDITESTLKIEWTKHIAYVKYNINPNNCIVQIPRLRMYLQNTSTKLPVIKIKVI